MSTFRPIQGSTHDLNLDLLRLTRARRRSPLSPANLLNKSCRCPSRAIHGFNPPCVQRSSRWSQSVSFPSTSRSRSHTRIRQRRLGSADRSHCQRGLHQLELPRDHVQILLNRAQRLNCRASRDWRQHLDLLLLIHVMGLQSESFLRHIDSGLPEQRTLT